MSVLLVSLPGCMQPHWSGPVHDDVVGMAQYPQPDPWVRNEDGQVVGMRVRLYLISSSTNRGAFVPGTITVALDVIERLPDGRTQRTTVYHWEFDEDAARDWRVVHPSVLGDSYGLMLRWPRELNLAGREVQTIFHYTRRDGRVVTKAGSRLRVPLYHPGTIYGETPSASTQPLREPPSPRPGAQER